MRTHRSTLGVLLGIAFATGTPFGAAAQIDLSPDITETFDFAITEDEEAVHDAGGGSLNEFSTIPLGTLPRNADLVGYERDGSDFLLSFDTTVLLGGVTAEKRDVLRYDGSNYTLEFDGSAEGVPLGANIDAVGLDFSSNLLLSFDTSVVLPGIGGVHDEAIVAFDGASFSVVFDGAVLGNFRRSLDTDAVGQVSPGVLRLSFDGSGVLGGVDFDDEDALDYDSGSNTWTLAYDASTRDPDWAQADLVALPEPRSGVAWAACLCVLAAMRTIRFRSRRNPMKPLSRITRRATLCAALALPIFTQPSSADDGVAEINHTCAIIGCFPGDASFYPITLGEGSYVLTGPLETPDVNTNAIEITGSNVTIDLNGFTIDGRTGGCTSSGPTISCPAGSGGGIVASGVAGLVVRNGTVKNTGKACITGGSSAVIEGVNASGCSGAGISVGSGSTVRESIVTLNGMDGILGTSELLAIDNVVYGNGGHGIRGTDDASIAGNVSVLNGDRGISTNDQATIQRNVATGNELGGIDTDNRSLIATNVASSAPSGPGIHATDDALIESNSASFNGFAVPSHGIDCRFRCNITGNAASANLDDGIHMGGSGAANFNAANVNADDGIECAALSNKSCGVVGNVAVDNLIGYGLRFGAAAAVSGVYKANTFDSNGAGDVTPAGLDPGLQNSCSGSVPCP